MFTSAGHVRVLRPFVATTQQQYDLFARNGVVHPLASTCVDAKLPHAVTAKLVIPKIALFNPVDAPVNRNFCCGVA